MNIKEFTLGLETHFPRGREEVLHCQDSHLGGKNWQKLRDSPSARGRSRLRAARPPHSAELPEDFKSPAHHVRQWEPRLLGKAVHSEVKACLSLSLLHTCDSSATGLLIERTFAQ